MTAQRLEKIESAPGNGMALEASNPQYLAPDRAASVGPKLSFRLAARPSDPRGHASAGSRKAPVREFTKSCSFWRPSL